MKPLCGIISAFAISVCLCVGAQAASVLNDRFTVSLPEGFKGQDPQTIGMNTKWTYVRERAPDNQDYRFRVTVLEGSKPLPDDSTGANVALGLLVSFTAQQTKSLTGLQFDAAKRTVLQGRVWWHTTWTGQGGKVQITGMSCIMHAYGADYFLVFESLAPEGESRLRNEILNSFEPMTKRQGRRLAARLTADVEQSMMTVRNTGYALFGTQIGSSTLASLRNRVFVASEAGTRCLLGPSQVQVPFRNRVGAYAAEMAIA